jgi:hypothetical protein
MTAPLRLANPLSQALNYQPLVRALGPIRDAP